jgi:hypothetical protein
LSAEVVVVVIVVMMVAVVIMVVMVIDATYVISGVVGVTRLYSDFSIKDVKVQRAINCKGSKCAGHKELLVSNS